MDDQVNSEKMSVSVRTGSRLHFGLLSLGNPAWGSSESPSLQEISCDSQSSLENSKRWFGGVGVMIDQPSVEVEVSRSDQYQVTESFAVDVDKFVKNWCGFVSENQILLPNVCNGKGESVGSLPVSIEVKKCPPRHSGMGVGTQLGLAIGQALFSLLSNESVTPSVLAQSVGRGLRSAVGTFGFFRGGLLIDRGKVFPNTLGQLDGAFELDESWRWVLLQSDSKRGLSGTAEKSAFGRMPEIPEMTSQNLRRILRQSLVPSAHAGDFETFSDSLYHFGYQVGQCFSSVQGGVFAGPRATKLVESVRAKGVQGVGQSSWGPTLFALCKDPQHATWLVESMSEEAAAAGMRISIAKTLGNGTPGSSASVSVK